MLRASTHDAPNWVDLSTPDPEAAARFYGDLFGWRFETSDSPMGVYRIAYAGARQVGGLMATPAEAAGMPSAWTMMVNVADVDATVGRVTAAGGTVLEPAFDLPEGRIAIVADSGGAMLGVIAGTAPDVAWLSAEHGAVCWVELLTRDVAAAASFYPQVFGWKPETGAGGGAPYTTFWLDGDQVAGMMAMPDDVPADVPSYWGFYVAVADCAAVAGHAGELGGTVLVPPMHVGEEEFAVLADPFGATFSIMVTSGADEPPGR